MPDLMGRAFTTKRIQHGKHRNTKGIDNTSTTNWVDCDGVNYFRRVEKIAKKIPERSEG